MADITMRNPTVVAARPRIERTVAEARIGARTAAAARAVRSAIERAFAAMEPAEHVFRYAVRGFDR